MARIQSAASGVWTKRMAAPRDAEFKTFYESEGKRVRELAMFLVGDSDLAADLAQEAFVRAYRSWGRIRKRDPGPYVRRALVNLCKNVYRKRATEKKHWAPPPRGVPSHAANVHETMRVTTALRELPPFRRAAVVLRYYEDMSDHHIAALLDRPLGTVKSDIRRGLQQLKPLLEEPAEELR
jgi:RNA polymerase sigma-70 factor (sigma-E family)